MSTYTDNNNTIDFNLIAGPTGPIGYTGAQGSPGPQGNPGSQGPPGASDHLSTDIQYSGSTDNGGIRTIDEGGIQLVGSCIFGKQADLRASGSTNVKVLVRAKSRTGQPSEIGLVLNGNIPDSNGETRIAAAYVSVPGTGWETDSAIVTLDLIPHTLSNVEDVLSLWAYIKPTKQERMDQLAYLNAVDPPYSIGSIQNWKYETFTKPYYTTPARLWFALRNTYNTENDALPGGVAVQWLLDIVNQDAANMVPGQPQVVYSPKKVARLLVNYLQIEE